MARLNVYVPDDLATRARRAGLNVSALTQQALADALAGDETDAWLRSLPKPPTTPIAVEDIVAAIDEGRDALGARG